MALTSTEEALVRQLLDQQAAILSLAGNEATITSKLGATKVTLSDLLTASTVGDTDLFLTRQGTNDKSVTGATLRDRLNSFLQTGTGAVATNVQSKLREFVSVKDFGAVGDGVTDDTAAIQAAIAHASITKQAIYAPAGTYFCGSSTITINTGIQMFGDGMASTVFSFSSGAGNAFAIAQGAGVVGLQLRDFAINGQLGGKVGLRLGDGNINNSTVDSHFQNLRIFNMSTGISVSYSWSCLWSNLRVQSCTSPAAFGNQVNASLFNNCAFVSFSAPIQMINCEGLEFNSCNISNHTDASSAITLFQSIAIFRNPYFENNSPVLATVGGSAQAFGSSFHVDGGILNSSAVIQYRELADISVKNLRVDKVGTALNVEPVGASAVAKLQNIAFQYKQTSLNATTVPFLRFARDNRSFSQFTNAYGGGSLSYGLYPGYLEVTQGAVNNGVQLVPLVVGEQYTLLLNVKRGSSSFLAYRGGNNSVPTANLSIPCSNTVFEKIVIPFIATENLLRLLFEGSIELKEIAVYEGVVGLEGFSNNIYLDRYRQWQYPAAPTVGTWARGDVVWNTTPSAGGSPGWVCVAGGTPGTWRAMANVAA